MTLRRLLFAHAVPTMAAVERYMATDNPANFEAHNGSTAAAAREAVDRSLPEWRRRQAADRLEAYLQLRSIRERVAATDYFGPSKWAVSDADTAETNPSPSLRQFLATRDPATPVSAFVHYADLDRARGYLSGALIATPERFAQAPSPAAQLAVTVQAWSGLAGYFRALGLRPWALAKLRARWETMIGQWNQEMVSCPMIGEAVNTHSTGTADPPGEMSRLLFAFRPTPLDLSTDESKAGAWRQEAFARLRGHFTPDRLTSPLRTRFGCRRDVDRTEPGRGPCALVGVDRNGTGCTGPTGDVHRIWLTNGAELGGGVNYADPEAIEDLFDGFDCVPRSLVDGRVGGPPPIISGPPGFNGVCAAVGKPISVAESLARSAIADFRANYNYFLPPLLWYLLLVRPLLLDLATRDPAEVIYEAALDVAGKNTWTLISCGQDVSGAVAEGFVAGDLRAGGIRAGVQRLVGVATTGVGVVSLFNPLLGAGLDSLARGIGAVVAQAGISDNFRLDVFGRVEPALDGLSITGVSRAVDASQAALYQPPPSPFEAGYSGNAIVVRDPSEPSPALAPRLPLDGSEPSPPQGAVVGERRGLGLTAMVDAIQRANVPVVTRTLPSTAAPTQPAPPAPPTPSGSSALGWAIGGTLALGTVAALVRWRREIANALTRENRP